jgi:hypothetical protein
LFFFNFRWFYFKKGNHVCLKENAVPICPDTKLSWCRTVFFNGAEMSWCRTVFFNGCQNVLVPNCLVGGSRLVWDSSAVRLLFFPTCWSRGTSESSIYGKQRISPCNSALAHFHVSWLSDFIFYPKPLYKSLHQSFFYSFITILPSVMLHSLLLPPI